MQTIWKYQLDVQDEITIPLPRDAKVLTVQVQHGTPCLWALVDPSQDSHPRTFKIFGTGHPIESNASENLKYIGTFQLHGGSLVFHVFEAERKENIDR